MQQGEQGPPGDVLGDDCELAGVVQTRPHKLDDAGVVEAAEDGDLSAEHVHVGLGAVGVRSVAVKERKQKISFRRRWGRSLLSVRIPLYGHDFVPAFASVDPPKGACEWSAHAGQ